MRTCPVSSFLLRYGMVLSVSGSGYETSTGTFFQIHSLASASTLCTCSGVSMPERSIVTKSAPMWKPTFS